MVGVGRGSANLDWNGAMINTVVHVETTPPLYFVLIWAWAHIFGNGEVALTLTMAQLAPWQRAKSRSFRIFRQPRDI